MAEKNTKGIIIVNLGSPDSPSRNDVKKYLKEFLMDEKVIDINKFFRSILVKCIIAPIRSKKSAEAYETVWTKQGSPLISITKSFCEKLAKIVNVPVTYCMRYGNPNVHKAMTELLQSNPKLEEVFIAPMYPHYAMSSYESALENVKNYITKNYNHIKIKELKPFYDEPEYINLLSASIKKYTSTKDYDAILFSYHGLPIRHLKKSDITKSHCYLKNECCKLKSDAWQFCYKHQVIETTDRVFEKLSLPENKKFIGFQSRLGKGWIEPYTDQILEEMPSKNIKKLLIICPAFVTDCLETLEEINIRAKEIFIEKGGKEFDVVACLNDSEEWVNVFASYLDKPKLWN
jgi:ferrochelatase